MLESSILFADKVASSKLSELLSVAHFYEDEGIKYWRERWDEEVSELTAFCKDLSVFTNDMKEFVSHPLPDFMKQN